MKKTIEIPENWNELSPAQFKYLLKLVFALMGDSKLNVVDATRAFADYLCGKPVFIRPGRKEQYLILLDTISRKLNWIFRLEDDNVVFDFSTTSNLIPIIGSLMGPKSHGSDFRFGEYRQACELYNIYTTAHRVEALDALVGLLYRPVNNDRHSLTFDGNFRQPFNKFHIELYANRAKRIPDYIKWGVYNWFGYFCKYLMSGEFIIEGNSISFAPVFERQADSDMKSDDDSLGMTSVLFSLAESRTFGNINETDNARLFDVMMKLLNDKQQIDKLKTMKK